MSFATYTWKHIHTSVWRGATVPWPPSEPKNKKCINSMHIFRGECALLGVICVFLSAILQNFPEGMPPYPPRMVGLKLICDVTRLWRNLPPLGNFLRAPLHIQPFFPMWKVQSYHAKLFYKAPQNTYLRKVNTHGETYNVWAIHDNLIEQLYIYLCSKSLNYILLACVGLPEWNASVDFISNTIRQTFGAKDLKL